MKEYFEELKLCPVCNSKAFSNSIRKNGERICCTNPYCSNRFRCATVKEWNSLSATDTDTLILFCDERQAIVDKEIERLKNALMEITKIAGTLHIEFKIFCTIKPLEELK